jgi:7,8-dihydropterin-6-yl-methyl-4-(beta-D-ribofuranosyl)aminobenzene 5'-phosphate synthase
MPTLTILSENTVRGAGLLGEHGLAYWIDTGTHRVLFDTGQGMALANNAAKLGIDLRLADAIVLSHGHYDHVSALPLALALAPEASLWFHPCATEPKFIRDADGTARRISTDFMELAEFGRKRAVHRIDRPAEIVPGVWATGGIPRKYTFEDAGGPFYLDEALHVPDPVSDDMAVFVPGPAGVSVVFGCAHAGALNTLDHVSRHTGNSSIHTLVGGLHLAAATSERMDLTMAALREIGARRMGFCHCTGGRAIRRIWQEFPDACFEAHAGKRITLGDAS